MQQLNTTVSSFSRNGCTFSDEPDYIKEARKCKAKTKYDDRMHKLSEQERKTKLVSSL